MLLPTQPTQDSNNVLVAEDPLGIVYLIEDSQQFWSGTCWSCASFGENCNSLHPELEDIVHIPNDNAPTLSLLDSALKRFISLCASYHGKYMFVAFIYIIRIINMP